MFNTLGNSIPTDWARRYLFDGDWNSTTGSNNATVTNWTWVKSEIWYQVQCLSWWASTSCTYASVTYTNSYIWIYASWVWTFTKNSAKVTATALNWVNWERYALLTFFNRTLTAEEEQLLVLEWRRLLWPTNIAKYPALLSGLVGYWDFRGTAHNLVDGVDWTNTNVTNWTDHLWNSWILNTYNWSSSKISLPWNYINLWTWDFTISMWVTLNAWSVDYCFLSNLTTSSVTWFSLWRDVSSNKFILEQWQSWTPTVFDSTNTYTTGTYFVSFQRLASWTLNIYVNWVLERTWTWTVRNVTTSSVMDFWRYTFNNTKFLNGKIDNCFIHNKWLSADEEKLLYNLTTQDYIYPTPSYDLSNLQDWLLIHLNGSNNWTTTLYDISWNGKNGTVSSTPTYKRQWKKKTVSLSSQSVSWTSTSFTMATCFEKVSWKWTLQVNPAYITTTWITSWTREITDIRVYNRSLSSIEQEQLKYAVIGNFIY